jgi:signal transduction histidine kinase
LIFSSLLVLIPGTLLGVIVDTSARRSLQSVIGRQLAQEAGYTADRLATLVRIEREGLRSFARQDVMRDIRVADVDKRISQSLGTLAHGSTTREGYVVLDERGDVVAASDPGWLLSPPAWTVRSPDAENRLEHIQESNGEWLMIAAPIPDPDHPESRIGTLVGLLDTSLLKRVTESVRERLLQDGITAEVSVVDGDGTLLPSAPGRDASLLSIPFLSQILRDSDSIPVSIVDSSAGAIVGHARFPVGDTDWSLLIVEPLDHALAPAIALRNQLLLIVGVALAAALVVAALGARRVLQPLSELTEAIRFVSRGKVGTALVPVRSEDEVGTLASAFNKMTTDLGKAQRHLVDAEKFAFVGQLAAGVAHEIRTSLGVLRNSAQILGRSTLPGADPSTREMIEMIQAEVARLSRVVDDLLHLGQRRPLDLRPTILSLPVQAAVDFVIAQAKERSITIRTNFSIPAPVVLCDADAIQQACVNLLTNAIAALNQGGTIDVNITPEIDGVVGLDVRDDGLGVPKDLADRVFDPFTTGRASGVGLGLTFVMRIVNEHHGSVRLMPHSEPGAWFHIVLPSASASEDWQ